MILSRRSLLAGLAGAAALAGSGASIRSAHAQAFPAREVTLIVPWNAGGSNDIAARILQPMLQQDGMRIIVENMPGATGAIGMRRVASADPDGYTLGMGTSSTLAVIAQGLAPLKNEQFTHLARVSTDPLMLLVATSSPHKTIEDFLAFMGKDRVATIGTPGNNNLNHIFAEMTARAAKASYTNVPYPGGAKVIADLSGGQIDAAVLKPSESLGQIRSGYVRPLGVFANERLAVFPDLPTFKERGFDVFPYGPLVQMAYLVAPAGLPEATRSDLIARLRKAIQSDAFKTFGKDNGFLVDDLTGDALTKEVMEVQTSLNAVASQVFKAAAK
ncbi:Bug family tripartite tricarboxylate transporter substrate binding protein [Methylopila sp. Yamaguchi]|uniref:Bug family tripartite tricarboxylate transporter substrate binding protein n=1 Tax=Methylopila sp. Yamaguchi TaxID=1437817 RepID=UPI000CC20ADE|nr:tripartite tricarboxylate transporter substrate binding protein [Methylopila sp. Yamaguchi]GBD48831.1 periplasmic binding protein [Methylopila sp. Yamaguchi]